MISGFHICSYNIREFAKNDNKLQIEKLEAATRYHDIVGPTMSWYLVAASSFSIVVLYHNVHFIFAKMGIQHTYY